MRFFTKTELRIFLIFWIIFSVFATSDRWNDNASLDLTMAIADERRFEIDSYANNTGDRAYYKDHYYSDKVPGTALLTVPLYELYKFFVGKIPYHNSLDEENINWKYQLFLFLAISLISAVCGALTVVLVYKISKYFTSNYLHRNLVIIVLGLGTLLPHAGRQFNSHAISTFFIFLCFYLIFKMKKEKTDCSLFAGMAGGMAVLVEYRAIILLFGLFIIILTFKKWKWILKFVIGALMFYSIILLYNHVVYNSAFVNPEQYADPTLWKGEDSTYIICNKMVYSSLPKSETVFELIINQVNYYNTKKSQFSFNRMMRGLFSFIRMMRILFDPFKGLFFYSPIMLFSFLGLFLMCKKYRLETLVIILCFLMYTLLLANSPRWWMGLSFGPRYLTSFIPFLAIPLLYMFKRLDTKMVLFFIIISVLISIIGLQSVNLSHDNIILSKDYCEKIESFVPLANPLFNNYLPSILKYTHYDPGHSQDFLILERLLGFRIVPFLNIALLLFTFLLIWKNKFIFKS